MAIKSTVNVSIRIKINQTGTVYTLWQNTRIYRGSLITNHSLVLEDLLLMLEPVIDQFGRFLIVRLNVPSIEEIKTWQHQWTTVFCAI